MKSKNKKNIMISLAMAAVLAVAGISAYFTATDDATNTFTVGSVDIQQLEPAWVEPTDIVPNQEIEKNPQVENTGDNDAYVFEVVQVPKASIKTSNTATGAAQNAAAVQQLFQLNMTKDSDGADTWTGTDTYHEDAWYLLETNPAGSDTEHYNTYVFAYGSSSAMTTLASGATTTAPVFESVTFCNALAGQSLENSSLSIKVNAFGIQANEIANNDSDATSPAAVWNILNTQDGAIAAARA